MVTSSEQFDLAGCHLWAFSALSTTCEDHCEKRPAEGHKMFRILLCAPVSAKPQDSLGALIFELNLSQGQIDQIRVVTTTPFNQAQAQQVSQQITAIAAQRMVNRLELRNQIFQVLNVRWPNKYFQELGYFSLNDAHRALLQPS